MSAMADGPKAGERPGVSWVTALLAFNLWVMLVGAPALHAGGGGWPYALLALAPLGALAAALRWPSPAMLRFVYPLALLAPLLLSRPLMAERTLGPAGALAVVISLAAWFLVAGTPRRPGAGPSRPARVAGVSLAFLFLACVGVVHFHPGVLAWIDDTWPGRAAEARVLLSLVGFMVWMAGAWLSLRILSRPGLVAAALLALTGCDGGPAPVQGPGGAPTATPAGTVVAEVDGRPISLATLQAAVAAEGAAADPRAVLERLITYELLYPRAVQAGLASDPEVVQVARQRAVQRLIAEEFESRTRIADVPERHLKTAFKRNERVYNHPNLMKLTHIIVLVAEDAPEPDLAAARALAEQLHAQVAALQPAERTHAGLRALIRPHKAGAIKLRAEDLGWKARNSPLVEDFLVAAFALTEDGQVSPVSKTKFGFHVIVRLGWQDELVQTYEDVRDDVLARLHPEWQQAEFMQWVEGLREGTDTLGAPDVLQILQLSQDAAAGLVRKGG